MANNNKLRRLGAIFVIGLLARADVWAAEPAIRVVAGSDGKPEVVEVVGLSKDWLAALAKLPDDDPLLAQFLSVHVLDPENGIQVPALAGRREVVGDALRFTPRYPLRPGLKYQAHSTPPAPSRLASPSHYTKEIVIPAAPPGEPTRVTAVYPSAATLPENQLRFYIHFSAPMSRGEAYTHVKLLKADGQPDKRAFLEIGEELWDTSGKRLTLLFDPGRVKQGLKPREEFGPVLEAGRQYTLVIDKAWRDAEGQPLAGGYEKRITAGPPVETAIDPSEWKLAPPAASTRGRLVVRFPRPLDHALLLRMLNVTGVGDKPIVGDITVADEERRWEFRPDQPWPVGAFSLLVDTTLEDTTGNNIKRPFEVDVFREVEQQVVAEFVRIPFVIAAR